VTSEPKPRPDAEISEEGLARLRARIGLPGDPRAMGSIGRPPEPGRGQPFTTELSLDAIRHFANGIGDDNPFWNDPEYAAATRWGDVIAPPGMLHQLGTPDPDVPDLDEQQRQLLRGDPLRGVHAFYSGAQREWWAPLRPGRRVYRRSSLVGVEEKRSSFAERTVLEHYATGTRDDAGTLLGMSSSVMIRAERRAARERGKHAEIERAEYTPAQIEAIEEQYEREQPRGAEPRWWEDVEEGDGLDPLVKGPLLVTDVIAWHAGTGQPYALRLAYKNRRRIRGFYGPNEFGYQDVVQRVHWDDGYAQSIGNPYAYDYGAMRENWLMHLCTDWMGDDGWLWKFDAQMRRFNFVGDVHWMRGRVTRKYLAEGDRPAVDLEIWGENQREEITCPGHATVLLPSREHGPVRLPDPHGGARNLEELTAALIGRYAE
jgi:acyl dehydratase